MDGMWQRVELPRLISVVADVNAPPMPILQKCDKCGEKDVDAFLDVNCLNECEWEECLGEHGIVVGTTLFRVRLLGSNGVFEDGAVCASCIRNNSWAAKVLQRTICVDLLTMAVAGVSLNQLWIAWASPLRCKIPKNTCPNSLRDIDDCTGWCDFCSTVVGFALTGPCRDRTIETLPKITIPQRKQVTSLGTMCSCLITSDQQTFLNTHFSLSGPKKLTIQKLCVQA